MIAVTILVINLAIRLSLKMIVVHVVATWPYQKTCKSTRKFTRYWKVAALQERGLVCLEITAITLLRSAVSMFPTQIGIQDLQIIIRVLKIASSCWTWHIGDLYHTMRLPGDGMMYHAHIQITMSVNSSHKPILNFSFIDPSILLHNIRYFFLHFTCLN